MYVIEITYTAPLERVDDALEAHRAFLGQHFEAGVFIAAGPKVPRNGGVIVAAGIERNKLDEILATDPFAQQQLARYDVTEFKATRLAAGLNLPLPA
ncbi:MULTISPECIES: YciI family protein [Paraburkholderia]|uniref:YciI family protein n=1 Tax=Paraburkholderia TaxID=1822464 RepID=UPI002255AFE1|nr:MULTISPECIES: YciI family protein [Paraburkholderia]MCX4160525.1 YciI family protein [Paraburkholderia megapolitana]MDN7156023.1 YciI family protein [Paraburkholderia sp. CHISQ3]MDQ6493067.1 YciI family protein [Paraburkholderia megapolitana]